MKDRSAESTTPNPMYPLGHSNRELARLDAQERLVGPITRQIFLEAGIIPGMRVLDIGSGRGDVAFLAADIVGDTGEVIGTDNAPAAVAAAQARAEAIVRHNVLFREGEPTKMEFEKPFDAIVGRYVLTFQSDPAAMLRSLARHLRPGGVMMFHEPDWDGARSFPSAPTYDRCHQWIIRTFEALGIETRMGIKLYQAFVAAGLPAPSMRLSAIIGGGMSGSDWVHQITELVNTLLPAIEQTGVATAAEVDIETLADRIRGEITALGSVIVGRSEIGAWSRV